MLETVWKKYAENFSSQTRSNDLGSNFRKPWGSEGLVNGVQEELKTFPNRYMKYQKAIRTLIGNDDVFPIEFDYLVWKQ